MKVSMSILAAKLNRIKPSPTMAVTARAQELKEAGENIIGLGAGEPDFDTPEHIKAAALEAMKQGQTKYTKVDGTLQLREAICEKFSRDNELIYTPDQINVGVGGKHVMYNALMATLNPGDEVIIPAPFWVSYPDMVLLSGGTPVQLTTAEADGFRLTPDALQDAITPKPEWLILGVKGLCHDGMAYRLCWWAYADYQGYGKNPVAEHLKSSLYFPSSSRRRPQWRSVFSRTTQCGL